MYVYELFVPKLKAQSSNSGRTPPNESLRISFGNIPVLLSGLLGGPVAGALVGAVADIIGCDLIADDKFIGCVIDVFSARTDIITVKCEDGKIMRFPYLNKVVLSVDIINKKIIVDGKRLLEVSCYED